MLAVAYIPAGKTIIHSSRRNPRAAWPRSRRTAPETARTGMSPVATDQKASARPVSAGRDAARTAAPVMCRICAAASTVIDAAPIVTQ